MYFQSIFKVQESDFRYSSLAPQSVTTADVFKEEVKCLQEDTVQPRAKHLLHTKGNNKNSMVFAFKNTVDVVKRFTEEPENY